MLILLAFAFISGIVTVFSPCIWPILPVVLSSTAASGRYRPFGIVVGVVSFFALSMILFTVLVENTLVQRDTLKYLGVGVIAFFGLMLVFPRLERYIEERVGRLMPTSRPMSVSNGRGFWGGLILGGALGIVWTPCAGPVLLAISSLIATETERGVGLLLVVGSALGLAVPLGVLTLVGQKLLMKLRQLAPWTGVVRQGFGALMIATALTIVTDYHIVLQTNLTGEYPVCGPLMQPLGEHQLFLDALKQLP